MRLRRVPAAATALAAALGSALTVPSADAATAPVQVVTARNTFLPAEIVIGAGMRLELTNVDLERHDLTALDVGPNGPLFFSRTIGPGQRAEVVGVSTLERSLYPFFCTVHAEMVGNLTVL